MDIKRYIKREWDFTKSIESNVLKFNSSSLNKRRNRNRMILFGLAGILASFVFQTPLLLLPFMIGALTYVGSIYYTAAGAATTNEGVAVMSSTQFVVIYSVSGAGYALVGTIDGDTLSFNTEVSFSGSNTSNTLIRKLDSTHVVINWSSFASNSYSIIGTIATGQISFGSAYDAGTCYYTGGLAVLDSTHFVVMKIAVTTLYGVAVVGVVSSGNVVTYGSDYTFNAASTRTPRGAGLDSTHVAIAYSAQASSSVGKAIVGVLTSGNVLTFGSIYEYNGSFNGTRDVCALDANTFVVFYIRNYTGTARLSFIVGATTNDDDITFGTENATPTTGSGDYLAIEKLDSTHFIATFKDTANSNYGNSVYGTVAADDSITVELGYFNSATTNYTGVSSITSTTFIVVSADFADSGRGEAMKGTYSAVSAPTVTTQAVTDKATTSGTGNGNITATGGANATRRGFAYMSGTSGDPTTANSVVYDDGDYGTGAYTKAITGLTAGTAYRVRAYAVNSGGTSYGSTVAYTTTFEKTLTETPKMVSDATKLTGKTFTGILAIVPVYANVATLVKALTESLIVAGSILKEIGRNFIEVVNTTDTLQRALSAIKTFVEAVNLASTSLYSTAKTFVEVIVVAPVYEVIKALARTYSETINVIDQAAQSVAIFIETFTEVIVASDTIQKLFTGFKVLTEQVNVVVSFISSGAFYKVLSEAISATDSIVRSIGRTFSEIVVTIGSKSFDLAAIFTERLVVLINQFEGQRTKLFTETVVVALQTTWDLARVFTETVIVGWEKLTHRAVTYTERVVVRIGAFVLLPMKVLVERVIGATEWLFEKMQFVELTDSVVVVVGFINNSIRVFTERVVVVSSKLYQVARLFIESLVVGDWFQGARSYSFTETITVASEFILGTISKVLLEVVKVRIIFTEGRNWIMTETVAVADSILSVASKLFNELVSVVGAMAGASIGKLFKEVVVAVDTILFRKMHFKILSDSFSVVSQSFRQAGRIFGEVVSVVSSMGEWVIGKVIVQPVIVIDTYLKAWTLSRVLDETVVVVGNLYNQGGKIFSEVVSVVDTFVLGTISKLFIETVKIVEVVTRVLPAKVYSETVVVIGNVYSQSVKIFSETVEVVSEFVLGTISKLFIETVKVAYEFVTGGTFYKVLSEVVVVVGNGFNQGGKIFVEIVSAVDTFVLDNIAKMFYETVRVATGFTRSMTRVFSEIVIVVTNATKLFGGRVFTEVVNVVNPAIAKLTGRLFTETIVAGWVKIKLVLNGIQVGLWKKVARVTNGTWRKISRNDN